MASIEKLKHAQANYEQARGNRNSVATRFDRRLSNIKRQLQETADPQLQRTIDLWRTKFDRIRRLTRIRWEKPTKLFDKETRQVITEHFSNIEQLTALRAEITEAIKSLEN